MTAAQLHYMTAYTGHGKSLVRQIMYLGMSHRLRKTSGIHYLVGRRVRVRICGIRGEAQWDDTGPFTDDDAFEDFLDVLSHVLCEAMDDR